LAIHGVAAGALTVAAEAGAYDDDLLSEVLGGLARAQKELPSKLFYDERGSELFEEITRLPEYYLTRAETVLLRDRIAGWINRLRPRTLVELGAGSAAKTRSILEAMTAQRASVTYVPVDISADFLGRTAALLRSEYPTLHVRPEVTDFTRHMSLPPSTPRPALFAFLGSTIGNFPRRGAIQLLRRIRCSMQASDRFLLGVDLRKDVSVLERAYNDARGVTAAFNRNLLHVVNRRTGADFDVAAFEHRAFYDVAEHRIEMHLVSVRPQTVHFPRGEEVVLAAGESIRTEISCKYDRAAVAEILTAAGLELAEWAAHADGLFALALAAPSQDRETTPTGERSCRSNAST
jgi:L-histidine N-alpha-methyltransferase